MDWYIIIKVSKSTISQIFLRIARSQVTFLEMSSTCANQFSDSSIIRPNDYVVSTLLISKLPTLIAGSLVSRLSLFLEPISFLLDCLWYFILHKLTIPPSPQLKKILQTLLIFTLCNTVQNHIRENKKYFITQCQALLYKQNVAHRLINVS